MPMADDSKSRNDHRSAQTAFRFGLRLIILSVFSTLGTVSFVTSLGVLLWISIVLCLIAAILREEHPLDDFLNYWDEAAGYAALYYVIRFFTI